MAGLPASNAWVLIFWPLGSLKPPLSASTSSLASSGVAALPTLDLAEWTYFFVGVERVELARGSYVNGKQMYVEAFVPAQDIRDNTVVIAVSEGRYGEVALRNRSHVSDRVARASLEGLDRGCRTPHGGRRRRSSGPG